MTTKDLVVHENELRIRHVSADIVELFECILADADVMIPDVNREGDEDEAAIYGDTYSAFEDNVTDILVRFADNIKNENIDTSVVEDDIFKLFDNMLSTHKITLEYNKAETIMLMRVHLAGFISIIKNNPNKILNMETY